MLLTIIHFASCALLWFIVPVFLASGRASPKRLALFAASCLGLIAISIGSAQTTSERWHFLFFPVFFWP